MLRQPKISGILVKGWRCPRGPLLLPLLPGTFNYCSQLFSPFSSPFPLYLTPLKTLFPAFFFYFIFFFPPNWAEVGCWEVPARKGTHCTAQGESDGGSWQGLGLATFRQKWEKFPCSPRQRQQSPEPGCNANFPAVPWPSILRFAGTSHPHGWSLLLSTALPSQGATVKQNFSSSPARIMDHLDFQGSCFNWKLFLAVGKEGVRA